MKKLFIFLSIAALVVSAVSAFADPLFMHGVQSLTTSPESFITMAGVPSILNVSEIEKAAGRLSHYNGGGRTEMYTGHGDDLLSFDGDIRSFAQELDENLEKQFTISIANANAAQRVCLLQAGYLLGNTTLAAGQVVEGAFNDANAAAGLSGATLEQKSIQELMLFLNNCPTRLLAFKIQSTVANQVNNNLTYQRLNPFKSEETKTIRPKNFINQDTYQNDQVTFPVDVQLDPLSKLSYNIVGTSTNTVTMFFGASLNISNALEKKAARAKDTVAMVGKNNLVRGAKIANYKG